MTLVLSRVSRKGTVQVTDRLVTTSVGRPFDKLANKNLILLSPDATVAIGYTGVAYLSGVPTDVYLAQVLADRQFKNTFGTWLDKFAVPKIYAALQRLAGALHNILRVGPRLPFELNMVGLQRTKARVQPLFWQIYYSHATGMRLGSFPIKKHPKSTFIHAAPGTNLSTEHRGRLESGLASANTPELAESVMSETIRRVSATNRYVGPDCMSIYIGGRQGAPYVRARFLPAQAHERTIVTRDFTRRVAVAYSPWIISPRCIIAPAVMVGGWSVRVGSWTVDLDAPEDPYIRGYLSSQPRPMAPKK